MNKQIRLKIIEKYNTIAEFSHHIRQHQSDVSRVLHGKKVLKRDKLRQWSEALCIDVSKLLER